MTCFPVEENKAIKKPLPAVFRMSILLGAVFFVALAVLQPASATSVNWTEMIEMADGIASVMPSVGGIIQSIVGPILTLVFVGFFVGLFDSLLGGITNAMSFGRRGI